MKVLIICSGGNDSSAMAAINKNQDLTLMAFNYGQKGKKEIEVVRKLAGKLSAKLEVIDISFIKSIYAGGNQLTGSKLEVEDNYMPSVVVPLRNALFLQIGMIYAYARGFDKIVLGSHLDDITEIDGERMFPDCSPEFFKSFELAMDLGTFRRDKKVQIESASLLLLTKHDLIKKGYAILGDFMFETWSCYKSDALHCGVCESCRNRKKAYQESGIKDKTKYQE